MMTQTRNWLCFLFLFLSFTLHLTPTLAYTLNDCTIVHSENVTAGVSIDCSYCHLVSVPEDIPRDVISLILQSNGIKKINRTDFYSLSNLRELDLSWNRITHVDEGAFIHLLELKCLNMRKNYLTTLPDNMFQGLSNLLVLRLEGNLIQSINPAAFQFVPRLQELSLITYQITDIINILKLPRLQVLNISIHELESFQSNDLPLNMSSELRELRVESESIRKFSITTAVFPHLETIDMSDCGGQGWEWDIPDKYFLKNITTVFFVYSARSFYNNIRKALQSLDSLENLRLFIYYDEKWIQRDLLNIACNISTLRTLDLTYSNLKTQVNLNLSEILTHHCTQLTTLDLSFNDLTELSEDSIKQMKQLSHLNLNQNKLSKVPDDIKHLSMLKTLHMRRNNIQDLTCLDFLYVTRLTHLHLDNNHISVLKQCVFQHLNELKVLTVNDNSIWTFGDTFKTGLQKLELLELHNNDIKEVNDEDFINLKSLKHLELDCARNGYFKGLDELETLCLITYEHPNEITSSPPLEWSPPLMKSMRNFTIQFIPRTSEYTRYFVSMELMLKQMKNLEHFTADCNVYNDYSLLTGNDTFNNVPQLKTLALRSTNLPYLYPGMFYPIPKLEVLDLSNNKLKSLDFLAKANLTRIIWLDVSKNELAVINSSVFSFLPALRYVYIADNPFTCDCSNSDFLQWILYTKQTLTVFAHSYTCAYPLAIKGTRFLDFDYHSCEQMYTSFICYISSTCVIVLTLLTSFTYHFLRLHLLYAYYLFLAKLYDNKERKRGTPQRYDAFISYNVHDELWVINEMLPVLEGEQGWKLCLHQRDFLPGKAIIENITDAIYGSRKTICVISRHYLESEWCSREFQMASYRLFDEKKDVLILVFREDIPAQQLSPHYQMRRLMKKHTYLSWPQAGQHPGLFWQNLRRALEAPDTDPDLTQ